MNSNYAIILAGGSGTRLWPLSRRQLPKQLIHLIDQETLLQKTAKRLVQALEPDHIISVVHQDYKFQIKGQLLEVNPKLASYVLLEPVSKNTLPAISWAVARIAQQDPEAIIRYDDIYGRS